MQRRDGCLMGEEPSLGAEASRAKFKGRALASARQEVLRWDSLGSLGRCSASQAECTLFEQALATVSDPLATWADRPQQNADRLIGVRTYDSKQGRGALRSRGIEPIIPALRDNKKAAGQDGRQLSCYRHRWIVERTLAWSGWWRRVLVRCERYPVMFGAVDRLAYALIAPRMVMK